VVCEFHWQGVFIRVLGAITDLIKSVIRQVLAGRPSHVAGQPWGAASTNSRPRVPFHHLLESITTKEATKWGWLVREFGRLANH
jgi:hypothetical protein